MKKTLALLVFLMTSLLNFAEINDNLKLFDKEEIKKIEEKCDEIAKEKDITVYINTFNEDIGFVISNPERAFIINLKKIQLDNIEKFKVEISFTKDIEIDDFTSEIDDILSESTKLIEQEEYSDYTITVLDGIGVILEDIEIVPLKKMTLTKDNSEEEKKEITYYIFIVFLLMSIFLGVIFLKNKIFKK